MEKNHFSATAGYVTDASGRVLMVKSPRRGWEYPGGMVEPGEGLEDALVREIFEESGITARVTSLVGVYKNLTVDSVIVDFTCEYVSGEPVTSDESPEVGWFTPEEAAARITNPMTKLRFARMREGIHSVVAFRKQPFDNTVEIVSDTIL